MSDKTKNIVIGLATLVLSALLVRFLMTQKIDISPSTKQDIAIAQDFLMSEYSDFLEGASDAIEILVDKLENMVKSFENTPSNSPSSTNTNLEITVS